MRTKYFSAAWQDVKNSPGWLGKVALLTLLMLIPVFGWIVMMGYLLGWARDMAWGVHGPLPPRIFGNEDGKLFSRGFFAWLIELVFGLVPWALAFMLGIASGLGLLGVAWSDSLGGSLWAPLSAATGLASLATSLLPFVLGILIKVVEWIGWMRMSVYGRLSAGFQFGRIWTMLRHDTGGIMRILGMYVLMYAVVCVSGFVVAIIVALGFGVIAAVAAGVGAAVGSAALALAMIALLFMTMICVGFVVSAACVLAQMLMVRSLGYWTRQFDVPRWRGQDDPMPFEQAPPVR